jgi:hypothetical protein
MYRRITRWTLALLKTPPEPQPPMGEPASLRVFNAGRNYFRLRIFRWALVQIVALGGILFWTAFLIDVEQTARTQAAERANRPAPPTPSGAETKKRRDNWQTRLKENIRAANTETVMGPDGKPVKKSKRHKGWAGFKQTLVEVTLVLPAGAFALILGLKLFGFLVYLVQLPITYTVRRLDYEMRWYMVTDRSLRLRHGVWQISESTMSFANVQQVVVSQGPLQRLLGLADVKVTSAGGGGGGGSNSQHGESQMHTGLFHSVTNAGEIRDLILERLRRFREGGLGDPDEKVVSTLELASGKTSDPISAGALAAARELATEARMLRAALAPGIK